MASRPDAHLRATLPIPDRAYAGTFVYDAKSPDSAFPPIEPLRPPEGAPNVLIVLIDDAGYDHLITPEERLKVAMARQ